MPRSVITQDGDHFDEWESFTLDDDIYSGAESDLLEDWEDDGAIAEVREQSPIVIQTSEPEAQSDLQLDEESAEVFSLLERSQAKRSSELLELAGPSEDELNKIEEVGIDDYIDIVLAEDSGAVSEEPSAEDRASHLSHASNVRDEILDPQSVSTFDAEEDDIDEVEDHFSSMEEVAITESFGMESELVITPLFEGVAVSLPTLFDEDGEVEYKTTARLAKRLVDGDVKAVFVATLDGEGNTLSRKERKNLVRNVAKASDVLVIADVSAPSIRQSVQLADDCSDAGANGFVVTLDSQTRDPYALCQAIHEQNREASLFVKLVGDAESLPISPEFLYDLPISGVIDATENIAFFMHLISAYTGPVYVGATSMIATGHVMGAAGVVSAGVALNHELVENAFAGDPSAQAELCMWERDCGGANVRNIKMALESEMLISSTMRD